MRTQTQILVNDLERMGVILTCNNNRLNIDAPQGVLTARIKEQLKNAKLEIINGLLFTKPTLAHANQQPAYSPSTTKMKIYTIKVRGKRITALDPTGMPETEMKRILESKFGNDDCWLEYLV